MRRERMQRARALFPWPYLSSKGVLLGKEKRLELLRFLKLEAEQTGEEMQRQQGQKRLIGASESTAN
jgi:hypothetical protein